VTVTVVPPLQVTSVSPSSVAQGVSGTTLTVKGSGFPLDASATISGSGVTVVNQARVDSSTITMTVDVALGAVTGQRDVTVAGSGLTGTCSGCLTIKARPIVSSVTPSNLGQGASSATVKLAGTGFDSTTKVDIAGDGITWSVASRQSTLITLTVSLGTAATLSARDISVSNANGGQSTCVSCLTIVAGPTITAVSPTSVPRGTSTTVTLSGSNFDSRTTVQVSGKGITVGTLKVLSPTSMTAVLKVTSAAPTGLRSVTVTSTLTFGSSTLTDALRVT
jgi:hypothetical protein